MKRYKVKVIGIFVMLSALILQFQNCGSKASLQDGQPETLPLESADGDLSGIDNISTGGIQFVQSKTVVDSDDQHVSAFGTCSQDQNGGQLSWKLFDENDTLLFKGKSNCQSGIFEVAFDGADSLTCGASLKLVATFGAQAKTETLINKNCN